MSLFDTITMLDYMRPLRERMESRKVCGPYTWSPSPPSEVERVLPRV